MGAISDDIWPGSVSLKGVLAWECWSPPVAHTMIIGHIVPGIKLRIFRIFLSKVTVAPSRIKKILGFKKIKERKNKNRIF